MVDIPEHYADVFDYIVLNKIIQHSVGAVISTKTPSSKPVIRGKGSDLNLMSIGFIQVLCL